MGKKRRVGAHPRNAQLAQSVEHETLNLRVVGSSPTLGGFPILGGPCRLHRLFNNSESDLERFS